MLRPLMLAALLVACGSPTQNLPPLSPDPDVPVLTPLGLNDVSVLLPLPVDGAAAGYLTPESAGMKGALLPRAIYDQVPSFPVVPADGLAYERMRVVALRFDGCGGLPTDCHGEVRLVMQPIQDDGSARDSALHLFYRLTPQALAEVVDGLRALRAAAPEAPVDGPLDVHPSLVTQGVGGPYAQGLKALVLAHAGQENLTRVTFFLRAPPVTEVWFFGGLEPKDGVWSPMTIVGLGEGNQRVILSRVPNGHEFDVTPAATSPEDGRLFLSSEGTIEATDEQRARTMASYLRVENPKTWVPDQLPCAGCHLATYVTAHTRRTFGIDTSRAPERFVSATRSLLLKGRAETTPASLRAFGWFGREPMIAQRTVNETAAVLDDLESRF
jgi:hypothetical protein